MVDGHCVEIEGEGTRSDTNANPTGEFRIEPRNFFGEQCDRSQRKEHGTGSSPSSRHRRQLESTHLQWVGEIAGETAVMLRGHDAVEPGIGGDRRLRAKLVDDVDGVEFVVGVETQGERTVGEY